VKVNINVVLHPLAQFCAARFGVARFAFVRAQFRLDGVQYRFCVEPRMRPHAVEIGQKKDNHKPRVQHKADSAERHEHEEHHESPDVHRKRKDQRGEVPDLQRRVLREIRRTADVRAAARHCRVHAYGVHRPVAVRPEEREQNRTAHSVQRQCRQRRDEKVEREQVCRGQDEHKEHVEEDKAPRDRAEVCIDSPLGRVVRVDAVHVGDDWSLRAGGPRKRNTLAILRIREQCAEIALQIDKVPAPALVGRKNV